MALFGDTKLQSQYDTILSQLQGSGAYTPLTVPEQTPDSITEQLAQIYRPQVERAIAQRYGATKQQKAAIDVDAASRGMGTSTTVTDAKNRIMNAEASDIAGLESDYASQLAGGAMTQYQNYLNDKLKLDQYNQQLQLAMQGAAYDQAMQQYEQGMIEGTLPYDRLQLEWKQEQKKANRKSRGSGMPKWFQDYLASQDSNTPAVTESSGQSTGGSSSGSAAPEKRTGVAGRTYRNMTK